MSINDDLVQVAELQRRVCRMVMCMQHAHIEALRLLENAAKEGRTLDAREKNIIKNVTTILGNDIETKLSEAVSQYTSGGQ